MTNKMQDDEFESLLEHSLRMEAAPAGLAQRIDAKAALRRPRSGGFWLMALLSPARMAASAAVFSLVLGFAMGWGNAPVSEEQDVYLASALYAANDVGDF